MLVYRGEVPESLDLDLPTLEGSFAFPIKYGYASVGRVEEIGTGVDRVSVGDRVFLYHPHQTEYVVPAIMAVPMTKELDPAHQTLLANLETAINVVLDAHPRIEECVAVLGLGVVGIMVAQLLQLAGAYVIGIDPLPKRRTLAQHLAEMETFATAKEAAEHIEDVTYDTGADLVIECSGNPLALDEGLPLLAFQGTAVVVSWYGSKPVSLHLGGDFHRKRLRIISSQVGEIDPAIQPRWNRGRRLLAATSYLWELNFDGLTSHRLPFKDAARAYELLSERPGSALHVVLTYGAQDV